MKVKITRPDKSTKQPKETTFNGKIEATLELLSVNKPGRPVIKHWADAAKSQTVSLSENGKAYLVDKYGSLSEAIRLLTKGGKYEQLLTQVTELQTKLQEIQK